MKGLKITKG